MKTFRLTRKVRIRTVKGKLTKYCVPSCDGLVEHYELQGEYFQCVFFNSALGDIGAPPVRCEDCIAEFGGG